MRRTYRTSPPAELFWFDAYPSSRGILYCAADEMYNNNNIDQTSQQQYVLITQFIIVGRTSLKFSEKKFSL